MVILHNALLWNNMGHSYKTITNTSFKETLRTIAGVMLTELEMLERRKYSCEEKHILLLLKRIVCMFPELEDILSDWWGRVQEERTVEDIGKNKCYRGRSICLAVSGFTKAEWHKRRESCVRANIFLNNRGRATVPASSQRLPKRCMSNPYHT